MEWLTIKMPKCQAVFLVWFVLAVFRVRSSPVVNRVRVLDIPENFPAEDTGFIQNLEFHLRLKRQVDGEIETTLKPESLTKKLDVSSAPTEIDDSVDASGIAVDSSGKDLHKTTKIPGEHLGSGAATVGNHLSAEPLTTRTSLTSATQVGDSLVTEAAVVYSPTSAVADLDPEGRAESLSGPDNPSPQQTTHSVTPSPSTTTTVLVTPPEDHGAVPLIVPPTAVNKTATTTAVLPGGDEAPPPPPTTPSDPATTPESPIIAPVLMGEPPKAVNKTATTTAVLPGGDEDMAPPPPPTTPSDPATTPKSPIIAPVLMKEPPNNVTTTTTTNVATTTETLKVLNATHFQMPPVAAPEVSNVEETTTGVSEVTTGMEIQETGGESEGKVNRTETKPTTASEISGVFAADINMTTSDSLSVTTKMASTSPGNMGSNTTTFQETNTTAATVIDRVDNVTSALLGSGILPVTEINTTTAAQDTTLTPVTNVTEPATEEPTNTSLPYFPEVADVTNATTTTLQQSTTAEGIIHDVFNITNTTTTTQVPLNATTVSVTELDMNFTNATSELLTTNVTMGTTELANTITEATNTTTETAYTVTVKPTTLEPPTPNTTLAANTTAAAGTTTKSTLQEITVTIPTTATPTTTQNSTNHSAPVGQSRELSASALTAIITGSIIGFWIILGPIICLICKVRDKRKERYHTRLTNHSDPPADNGMLDAMIISELKKTSESSHDNGTTGKEKEYNTVANDKEETDRLRSNTAEHEF